MRRLGRPLPWSTVSTRPRLRLTHLWLVTGPLVLALLVAVVWVAVAPASYYLLAPGQARAVEPLITITSGDDGPELHEEEAREDLLFLTVNVRQPFGLQLLDALDDDTIDVVQQQIIDGSQSRERNRQFNRALMTNAKDKAAKVALERAGIEVGVSPAGAVIVDTGPDFPVAKVLFPGDVVLAADGVPVARVSDLVDVIAAHRPGESVTMDVISLSDGAERTVDVELAARPDDPSRAMLGVSLETRPEFDFPVDVEIDSGSVSGSSAGLAFALAILDQITPGKLTGGETIAVTGTIELDSSVGPVGGVRQKTEAAVRVGAVLMLVPEMEYEEAKAAARGRLEVRSVTTFEEALDALVEIGGDPVPAELALPPAVLTQN